MASISERISVGSLNSIGQYELVSQPVIFDERHANFQLLVMKAMEACVKERYYLYCDPINAPSAIILHSSPLIATELDLAIHNSNKPSSTTATTMAALANSDSKRASIKWSEIVAMQPAVSNRVTHWYMGHKRRASILRTAILNSKGKITSKDQIPIGALAIIYHMDIDSTIAHLLDFWNTDAHRQRMKYTSGMIMDAPHLITPTTKPSDCKFSEKIYLLYSRLRTIIKASQVNAGFVDPLLKQCIYAYMHNKTLKEVSSEMLLHGVMHQWPASAHSVSKRLSYHSNSLIVLEQNLSDEIANMKRQFTSVKFDTHELEELATYSLRCVSLMSNATTDDNKKQLYRQCKIHYWEEEQFIDRLADMYHIVAIAQTAQVARHASQIITDNEKHKQMVYFELHHTDVCRVSASLTKSGLDPAQHHFMLCTMTTSSGHPTVMVAIPVIYWIQHQLYSHSQYTASSSAEHDAKNRNSIWTPYSNLPLIHIMKSLSNSSTRYWIQYLNSMRKWAGFQPLPGLIRDEMHDAERVLIRSILSMSCTLPATTSEFVKIDFTQLSRYLFAFHCDDNLDVIPHDGGSDDGDSYHVVLQDVYERIPELYSMSPPSSDDSSYHYRHWQLLLNITQHCIKQGLWELLSRYVSQLTTTNVHQSIDFKSLSLVKNTTTATKSKDPSYIHNILHISHQKSHAVKFLYPFNNNTNACEKLCGSGVPTVGSILEQSLEAYSVGQSWPMNIQQQTWSLAKAESQLATDLVPTNCICKVSFPTGVLQSRQSFIKEYLYIDRDFLDFGYVDHDVFTGITYRLRDTIQYAKMLSASTSVSSLSLPKSPIVTTLLSSPPPTTTMINTSIPIVTTLPPVTQPASSFIIESKSPIITTHNVTEKPSQTTTPSFIETLPSSALSTPSPSTIKPSSSRKHQRDTRQKQKKEKQPTVVKKSRSSSSSSSVTSDDTIRFTATFGVNSRSITTSFTHVPANNNNTVSYPSPTHHYHSDEDIP